MNIQWPTSNLSAIALAKADFQIFHSAAIIRIWKLVIGYWLLDIRFFSALCSLRYAIPASAPNYSER